MEENNNVVTRAPPTYNSSNAWKVGLRLKRLQRVWFGGEGKEPTSGTLIRTSFGRCSIGKASLP